MTVKALCTLDRAWTVSGNGYDPAGSLNELNPEVAAASAALEERENYGGPAENPDLERLLQICLLCNNSTLEQQDGQWVTKGDPTEGALLALAAKKGMWLKDMSTGTAGGKCRSIRTPPK